MKKLTLAATAMILLLPLSACASGPDMTGWRPDQIEYYRAKTNSREFKQLVRGLRQLAQENAPPTTAYVPYQQPAMPNYLPNMPMVQPQTPVLGSGNAYSSAYCRELASDMITCKQIR